MFRNHPSSSPGPGWEALQEPEASSDDELDTEDGEIDAFHQSQSAKARFKIQRAAEAASDPPQSAPPASASTSANAVVGDASRAQMKRKESEYLFPSKKRARFAQAAHSDEDAMDLDLNQHVKDKKYINSQSPPVQGTMGGLSGKRASLTVSSLTMDRKQSLDNSSTSPSTSTNAISDFPRNKSSMKAPLPPRRSTVAESNRPKARDPPSKLAGLPFAAYKRAGGKTVPLSASGRSITSPAPVEKPVDKGKASMKRKRVTSAPQSTRRSSTSMSKPIPSDAEIIEISGDDDSPTLSTSNVKPQPKSKPTKPSYIAPSSAPKKSKAPIEVIEILDSDDEQLPSNLQPLQQKNVGISSTSRLSQLVQECATGSNAHRGQSPHMASPGDRFENSDGGDKMNVDEAGNLLRLSPAVPTVESAYLIASDSDDLLGGRAAPIPRASSSEMQVINDASDDRASRGLIPLPSSSPSSTGFSPKVSSPSSPPPTASTVSPTRPPLSQQTSVSTKPNSIRKPISAGAGASTSSHNNRLGFLSLGPLQAPPPADKHSKQFARKMANQATSDQDEDSAEASSELSEKEVKAQKKANKGKEKEIRQSTPSSSGTESINMRGLRNALGMGSEKLIDHQPILATQPKKVQGQTLAEAITSAGQLNRTKRRNGRRPQGSTQGAPKDLTSDLGVKEGALVDENEKALKGIIGGSRLLVNLLPTLKGKSAASVGVIATAAKVTGPVASSHAESPSTKIERSSYPLSTSPERNIMDPNLPSQMSPPSLPMGVQVKSEPFAAKTSSAADVTAQPQTEESIAFGFRSGAAVIGPPKRMPLPKRPSVAILEGISATGSGASQQTSPTSANALSGEVGEGGDDVPMADVFSISPNIFASSPSAATVMTPSSIPLPSSPCQTDFMDSSASILAKPFNRPTPPKKSPLSETPFLVSTAPGDENSNVSSQQAPSTSTAGQSPGGTRHDNESMTVISSRKSHSPKLANSVAADVASTPPQPTTISESDASRTVMHPSTTTAPISPCETATQDTDGSHDDDAEECQALLQSSPDDMDVIPTHDVQSSLQDSIVVRYKTQSNIDTTVASSSALTSISATPEILDVSPPIPEVPTRRSSRRSSRSSTSEAFGRVFDDDFGPVDSVPATRTPTPEDQEPSSGSPPSSPKTYGGFRALTWKVFRKDLNNFVRKCYYAKDLPHALQDHINSMSEYTQMMDGMRVLFEATILENTVEDEPDAPPIEILNHVDNQSTPPWEFYYTNHMWLGEGVPPPDIKNLVSCTCKGGCNPKSKNCACLMRQREAAGDPLLEFAYDKNGKLKVPGYPIFECNDLCGCSDECRNRVVQHGRKVSVNIAKTETKGWGVFAGSKRIPVGTFIGIYSGELLTDAVAHERGVKYNKFGRTYLFDIDFHHLKDGNAAWENYYTVDAYHAGNFTRFLNHSCDPNCRLYACYINEGDIQKPLLAIFSRRDIEPYEEICFNYQGSYPDNDDEDSDDDDNNIIADPDHGRDIIYVPCRCGAKNCTGTMFK